MHRSRKIDRSGLGDKKEKKMSALYPGAVDPAIHETTTQYAASTSPFAETRC